MAHAQAVPLLRHNLSNEQTAHIVSALSNRLPLPLSNLEDSE